MYFTNLFNPSPEDILEKLEREELDEAYRSHEKLCVDLSNFPDGVEDLCKALSDGEFSEQEKSRIVSGILNTALTKMKDESPEWAEKILTVDLKGIDTRLRMTNTGGAYKINLIDFDSKIMAQVPRKGNNFSEKLKRVITWKNNARVLQENGLATPSEEYSVWRLNYRGREVPALVGEYNKGLVVLRDMEEEIYNEITEGLKDSIKPLYSLITEGKMIARGSVDYQLMAGENGTSNLGYDFERDEYVISDIGEVASCTTHETSNKSIEDEHEMYMKLRELEKFPGIELE